MKEENTYCDKIHELILLEDSGELSREQAAELGKHLESCPACAEYRSDLAVLMEESRTALPDGIPSAQAMNSIMAQAESAQINVVHFNPWRMVASVAAVLAVVLGTYLALYTPENKSPAAKEGYGIGDVQIIVALASDGDLETTSSDGQDMTDEDQLKQLADRLLKLQGFRAEDTEEAGNITDLFIPTALQSHSRPGSPARTSV